jgi:hypothetical protein
MDFAPSEYQPNTNKIMNNKDQTQNEEQQPDQDGTDIHVGPGQEQHLPHEAWHVVQEKKRRRRTTPQVEGDTEESPEK